MGVAGIVLRPGVLAVGTRGDHAGSVAQRSVLNGHLLGRSLSTVSREVRRESRAAFDRYGLRRLMRGTSIDLGPRPFRFGSGGAEAQM